MSTGAINIQGLAAQGEGERLEYKLYPCSVQPVVECICGMLNACGGTIVLGIQDDGTIQGIQDAEAQARELEQKLRGRVIPDAGWSVSVGSSKKGNVIVIDVPRGSRRPYLVNGTIHIRRGTRTVRATPEDMDGLIRDRMALDQRWERRPARNVDLDDLDTAEIDHAVKEIQEGGRFSFAEPTDRFRVLADLSLLVGDEITNAGVILFGRKPTAIYRQASFRMTLFEGDKTGSAYLRDEIIEGHLFHTLARLIALLNQNKAISSRFHEGLIRRQDRPAYPLAAIREGILNALVHRDYESPAGGATVGLYPDRIQLWNSGCLPDDLTSAVLKREHPSLPRNPDIAHVCFLRGLIEKIGRGTQLIAKACAEANLKPPVWKSDSTGTCLVFGERSRPKHADWQPNSRQKLLLSQVRTGEEVTLSTYVALGLTTSDRTARSDLAELVRIGVLSARGAGRARSYIRTNVPLPDDHTSSSQ